MSVLKYFKNIPRSPSHRATGPNYNFFFFKFATKSLEEKKDLSPVGGGDRGLSPSPRATAAGPGPQARQGACRPPQHLLQLQCLDMLHLALPHSLCTPTPDFVHLLRHDCQIHAPSTLLAMSTALHQMSPHFLPSPLRFGLLPPSRPQCYVSSLSLISKALWSYVLVFCLF